MPPRKNGPKTTASRKSGKKSLGQAGAGQSSSSTGSGRPSTTPESTSTASSSRITPGKTPTTGSEQLSTTPESTSAASSSRFRHRKRQVESDDDDVLPTRRIVRRRVVRSPTPDRPTSPQESPLDDVFEPRQQEQPAIHEILSAFPSFPSPSLPPLQVSPSLPAPTPSSSIPILSPDDRPSSPAEALPVPSKRPNPPEESSTKRPRKKPRNVDLEAAERRRIEKNEKAASTRRQPGSHYQTETLPSLREASAKEKAKSITDYFEMRFAELVNAHRATTAVLEIEYNSSLEKLQALFNAYRREHHLTEIPAEHPFWLCISEESADFLLYIASNPTSWLPAPYMATGLIIKQTAAQRPPARSGQLTAQVYIRRLEDVTPAEHIKYMLGYPADLPDSVFTCINSGIPFEEVRREITLFAEAHDFGPAILRALDDFEKTYLPNLPLFTAGSTTAHHYLCWAYDLELSTWMHATRTQSSPGV